MDAGNSYLKNFRILLHSFIGATGIGLSVAAYAFTNFATKADVNEHYAHLEKSLDDVKADIKDLIRMELKRRK